jgi:hypothetical protein
MKTTFKTFVAAVAWVVIAAVCASVLIPGCTRTREHIAEEVSDYGLILNDDFGASQSDKGTFNILNLKTGKITIKDVELDWTAVSRNDSLAVFCSDNKRGYYNIYTGEIAIPAQYRRAWVFSEGLAAVQKNGNIGFINRRGEVVIDFRFPYHGNPLSSFVFEDGHCCVADTTGNVGVINNAGEWLILPEYDNISAFKEYAVATKAGVNLQVAYDGTIINSFVLDNLRELTYSEEEKYVDKEGDVCYVDHTIKTGYFSYTVGGRCGLLDGKTMTRLTEPLYTSIRAVRADMFRATLLDHYSEVILDGKGQVLK